MASDAGRARARIVRMLIVAAAGLIVGAVGVRSQRQRVPAPPPPPPPRGPTLPAYVMNIAGGKVELRSTAPGEAYVAPVVLEGEARLEVVVRPEREVTERVDIRLFWVKGDGVRAWQITGEPGRFSDLRYRGSAERPFGAGEGELVAVVSAAGDIPAEPPVAWLRAPPPHWRVPRQNVLWR
jgi:hypothetical protein